MLSEQDFDDLIQLDQSDSRRHLWLTGLTILLAVCMPAMPMVMGTTGVFDLYSKIAGLGTALLGAVPAAKLMAIRKNIDRINMIRSKWRRLKDTPGDTKDELSKVGELLWAACK